jgi:hypothetical protein
MHIALFILPNSLKLFLLIKRNLFSHLCRTVIIDDSVIYHARGCIEVLGKLVFEIEGEYEGHGGHIESDAVDVPIYILSLKANGEIAASDCFSPTTVTIEHQFFTSFFHGFRIPTQQDQASEAIPCRKLRANTIDILFLRAHVHSLPIPVASLLYGYLLIPMLEVAILKLDAVGPDPGEYWWDRIAFCFVTAVLLAVPGFLSVADRVAVVWLGHHFLPLPYAGSADIVSWHASCLFSQGTVCARCQCSLDCFLAVEDSEKDQQEK